MIETRPKILKKTVEQATFCQNTQELLPQPTAGCVLRERPSGDTEFGDVIWAAPTVHLSVLDMAGVQRRSSGAHGFLVITHLSGRGKAYGRPEPAFPLVIKQH